MAVDIPASHLDLLEDVHFATLATISPGDTPHTSVMWFVHDGDGVLRMSTTAQRQKPRNLEHSRAVSVMVFDEQKPYRYVELRGEVTAIDPDPEKALIDQLAKRYLGKDEYPWKDPSQDRVILTITPDKVITNG